MKRLYLKLALDALILGFFGFIISFVVFYYFAPRQVAIALAVTVSALLSLSIIFFGLRSDAKLTFAREREKLIADVITELCFMPKPKTANLFFEAFTALNLNPVKVNGGIFLPDKNQTAFFCFDFDGLKKSNIVKAFNRLPKSAEAVIYTADCDGDTLSFSKRFDGRVTIKSKLDAFQTLEKANRLPQIKHELIDVNKIKKLKLSAFLDRKKAVKFLTLGVCFLSFSFFVPLKLYYIIFGGALSAFALGVLIFAKRNA